MEKPLKSFLYPQSPYAENFTSNNFPLDADLSEFCIIICYVCRLESEGKMTHEEAYNQIKNVWHELRHNEP